MTEILESLRRAIRLIVGKCVIEASKLGSDGVETNVILLGGEKHSAVRLMQHYGFASVPGDGAEAVALFVGGARDNGVVVSTQGPASQIPKLEKGESCLFSQYGQSIIMKKDGSVQVFAASGKDIVFNNRLVAKQDISCDKNVKAGGNVSAQGDVKTQTNSLNLHVHSGGTVQGMTLAPQTTPPPTPDP